MDRKATAGRESWVKTAVVIIIMTIIQVIVGCCRDIPAASDISAYLRITDGVIV
jgi:hypothetical protein